MFDVVGSLLRAPENLCAFTAIRLAEIKAQAMLIENLQHHLARRRAFRHGHASEKFEQLHLALEASEIAPAAITFPDAPSERRPQGKAEAEADP